MIEYTKVQSCKTPSNSEIHERSGENSGRQLDQMADHDGSSYDALSW
jgi:hypothetical protein